MSWITILILLHVILNCHGKVEMERKVVNGERAENIIPYQASIRVSVRDYLRFGRGHTCGGVLISPSTTVTAAHCVVMADGQWRSVFDMHVVLGSLNRYIHTDATVIVHLQRIVVHHEYQRLESFAHDIALVIHRRPVEITDLIRPIALIDFPVTADTKCRVSGWGATEWRGLMPAELQKANVSIVERDFCNSSYSYAGIITNGMICANGRTESGEIIDVCQGDSGGPLQCSGLLVGLSSFGVQCGASIDHPGVFTDIYYYRDWIMANWSGGAMQKSHKTSILVFTLFVNLIWKLHR